MAYCIYCGKKLEDGEVCNCRNIQNNQGSYNQTFQADTQQYQNNFNQAKEVSGIYLQQLFGAFMGIFKKPVTQGKIFVSSGNVQLGVGFLAIQAILSSLFALAVCNKINSLGKMAVSLLNGSNGNIISYPKSFLLTIAGSLAMSFALAGLLYIGITLFKGKTAFGQVICAVAVRSVGVSIFIVLSIIVVFLNIGVGFAIFILSWIVGLVFMIPVIQAGAEFNSNGVPYMTTIVASLSIVVFFVWSRISLPMYASELVEEIGTSLKNLGNLNSLFY